MKIFGKIIILLAAAVLAFAFASGVYAEDDNVKKDEKKAAEGEDGKKKKKKPEKPEVDPDAGKKRIISAYKKEFAFLDNERESLRKRIEEIDQTHKNKAEEMDAEIKSLESKFSALTDAVAKKTRELTDLEEKNIGIEDIKFTVNSTLSQAAVTLEQYGVEERDATENETEKELFERVDKIFDDGVEALSNLDDIRREKGSFYLLDGRETEGTIVKVGNIASLGVSPEGSGTLAPAGMGRLMLWNTETAPAARALAKSLDHPVLPLYVYKNLDKGVDRQQAKTPMEVVEAGGIIAYVIVGLGALGFLMLFVRMLLLWWSSTNTGRLVKKIAPLVKGGEKDKALEISRKSRGTAAKVLTATITHLHRDPSHLEDVIAENILHESPRLDRFESSIKVFAAVAPLLGLLGTVTGMISTFDVITVYGTGDPKMLSGGISEALITTQLGLMVAIPLLILGSVLNGWSESIKQGMENAALRITNIYKGFQSPDLDRGPKPPTPREAEPEKAKDEKTEETREKVKVGGDA